MRAQSFATLRHLLSPIRRDSLLVLDLRAGNGWLSHNLTALGHLCIALDWLDDSEDGLGACVH